MIENLLTHHDYTLLAHFTRHKVTSQVSRSISRTSIASRLIVDLCLVTSGDILLRGFQS